MCHDKKKKSKELRAFTDRERRSVLHAYHEKKKFMLVCCINKKKSGKKTMIVLSTMHENGKVKKDQRKKPQLHTIYNYRKGGVDAADLLSANHSTRMKSMKWPLNTLVFILNTCRSNVNAISVDNSIKFTNFEFTYSLAKLHYSILLNDDTTTEMDSKSNLSTKCNVFFV